MCLIVFSFNHHEKYPVILAGNRDEFYDRPTRQARLWKKHLYILAGKDLEKGGTWLGINRGGTFGAITNYRDFRDIREDTASRGEIVLNLLKGSGNIPDFIDNLDQHSDNYNGFNLLAGNTDEIYHYSNKTKEITEVNSGIHGISNALLNTPWPKVEQAKSDFSAIISSSEPNTDDLFEMLYNKKKYPLEKLPDTGLSDEMEIAVSAAFIETENYGTRCSTILMIDYDGNVNFIERTYQPEPKRFKTLKFAFKAE